MIQDNFLKTRCLAILEITSSLSMEEQKEEVSKVFFEWRGEQEQVDDVTLIGIKINL